MSMREHVERHGSAAWWIGGPPANRSARLWALRMTISRRAGATQHAREAFWRRVRAGQDARHAFVALLRRALVGAA